MSADIKLWPLTNEGHNTDWEGWADYGEGTLWFKGILPDIMEEVCCLDGKSTPPFWSLKTDSKGQPYIDGRWS